MKAGPGAFMDVWGGRLLLVVLEIVDAVLTVPLPTPELPSTQLLLAWEEEDDDCGFGIPRLSAERTVCVYKSGT